MKLRVLALPLSALLWLFGCNGNCPTPIANEAPSYNLGRTGWQVCSEMFGVFCGGDPANKYVDEPMCYGDEPEEHTEAVAPPPAGACTSAGAQTACGQCVVAHEACCAQIVACLGDTTCVCNLARLWPGISSAPSKCDAPDQVTDEALGCLGMDCADACLEAR